MSDIIKELCPELAETEPGKPLHAKRLPFLRNVITVDCRAAGLPAPGSEAHGPAPSACPRRGGLPPRRHAIDKHDVCNMQYTSGTTGFPKGVMLTHYNVVNNGKAIGDCMDLSTADRLMIQVPMFHCFGMVLAMTAAMTHGTTMYAHPGLLAAQGSLRLHQPGADHRLPRRADHVHRHARASRTSQRPTSRHMRTGIMAGSPLPGQGDAGRRRQDAHERDLHHLRPDRGLARLHHEPRSTDSTRDARQHRRRRRCSAWSARSSTPRPARTCPTTWTASSSPAATTS